MAFLGWFTKSDGAMSVKNKTRNPFTRLLLGTSIAEKCGALGLSTDSARVLHPILETRTANCVKCVAFCTSHLVMFGLFSCQVNPLVYNH